MKGGGGGVGTWSLESTGGRHWRAEQTPGAACHSLLACAALSAVPAHVPEKQKPLEIQGKIQPSEIGRGLGGGRWEACRSITEHLLIRHVRSLASVLRGDTEEWRPISVDNTNLVC